MELNTAYFVGATVEVLDAEKLRDEVIKLRAELAESRKATEAVQAELIEVSAAARTAQTKTGDAYLELIQRHGRTMQALSRANAGIVQIVRALRALVDVSNDVRAEEGWTNNEAPFAVAIRQAEELLSLVEIPF